MSTTFIEYSELETINHPHFESHKRGRNWVAKLEGKNSVNFERAFLRMRGQSVDVSSIQVGDSLEFGADYMTSTGRRKPLRSYFLVREINDSGILFDEFETVAQLLKAKTNLTDITE